MTERYDAFILGLGGCLTPAAPCFSLGIGGVSRDNGFAINALAGMDLRCEGGNGHLFNGVEALWTPLNSYPLAAMGNYSGSSFE